MSWVSGQLIGQVMVDGSLVVVGKYFANLLKLQNTHDWVILRRNEERVSTDTGHDKLQFPFIISW